jgi:hypothetical protein
VRVEYENERERASRRRRKKTQHRSCEDGTELCTARGLWVAYHMTPPAGASALHSAGFARG